MNIVDCQSHKDLSVSDESEIIQMQISYTLPDQITHSTNSKKDAVYMVPKQTPCWLMKKNLHHLMFKRQKNSSVFSSPDCVTKKPTKISGLRPQTTCCDSQISQPCMAQSSSRLLLIGSTRRSSEEHGSWSLDTWDHCFVTKNFRYLIWRY